MRLVAVAKDWEEILRRNFSNSHILMALHLKCALENFRFKVYLPCTFICKRRRKPAPEHAVGGARGEMGLKSLVRVKGLIL